MKRGIKWNRQLNDPRFWAPCRGCGADVGPFRFYAQADGVHYCDGCKASQREAMRVKYPHLTERAR